MLFLGAGDRRWKDTAMTERTCAACDCELDDSAIPVTVQGRTVEVCCEDCAVKLKEAHTFTKPGGFVHVKD